MYLTLEVDLVPLWVPAGCEVNGRHVKAVVGRSYTLHIAHQVRVFLGLVTIPHHNRIIVML